MELLKIGFILYGIAIVISIISKNKYMMLPTIVLWFIPIFTVDDIFVIVFSIIMILLTIYLILFNGRNGDDFYANALS